MVNRATCGYAVLFFGLTKKHLQYNALMAHTVYLLGAGINRGIIDDSVSPMSKPYTVQPPLAHDLFQQWARHPKVLDHPDNHREVFGKLYAYIERYWKLDFADLAERPFDLEACFTLIQLQKRDAGRDVEKYLELTVIEEQLTTLLQDLLNWFLMAPVQDLDLLSFGKLVMEEHAAVLTFNYDTYMEQAMESATGHAPIRSFHEPFDISHSYFAWNRPLAYGIAFDEVEVHQVAYDKVVSGEEFYSHPKHDLYDPPLLKLHGSLNWRTYTKLRESPTGAPTLNSEQEGRTRIVRHRSGYPWGAPPPGWGTNTGSWERHRGYGHTGGTDGFILKPLLVTPVMYKDLSEWPFSEIWLRAKEALAECKRLVVGGYSFPPTDFMIRRLFLEVFADNSLDELIVINPDTRITELSKELCHLQGTVITCQNLAEYLDRYATTRFRWESSTLG